MNTAILALIGNDMPISVGGLLIAILPFIVIPVCIIAVYGRGKIREIFAVKSLQSVFVAICVIIFGINSYTKDGPNHGRRSALPRQIDPDTDGDGIPDWFECLTHTQPQIDDGEADYDNDGLTNLQEYQFCTDPIRADTDGDGFLDGYEVSRALQGIYDFDPLEKATFKIPYIDSDGDGIPDFCYNRAETILGPENGILYIEDGILDCDYRLKIKIITTRVAKLDLGFAAYIIAPCTNRILNVGFSSSVDVDISLMPIEEQNFATNGLWFGSLTVEPLQEYGCIVERNRLKTAAGTIVECREERASFFGELEDTTQSNPTLPSDVDTFGRCAAQYHLRSIRMDLQSMNASCMRHGPPARINAGIKDMEPNFIVSKDGGYSQIFNSTNIILNPAVYSGNIKVSEMANYTNVFASETIKLNVFDCGNVKTNITGAAWTSTHNPDDPHDHEPSVSRTTTQLGENCPPSSVIDIKVGFTHNANILHTRNLERIVIDDPNHDDTDHCIGVLWKKKATWNLFDYLDNSCFEILKTNDLYFIDNGRRISNTIQCGKEPNEFYPTLHNIKIYHNDINIPLDQMWFVINNSDAHTNYNSWVSSESANTNWLSSLPTVYSNISILTNATDEIIPVDPEPSGNIWQEPTIINKSSYMHHNARYEMRSSPVAGGYGHQATYDENGNLITKGIAAGSADKYSPNGVINGSTQRHRESDVHPFIRALQLDGNPIHPSNWLGTFTKSIPTRLSAPALYMGEKTTIYYQLRPVTPTGVITNKP